jgi:hypothetical protein
MNLGTDTEYIPRDDESEAKRVDDIRGIGDEVVYLDPSDIGDYNLADFNLRLPEESK